MCTTSPIQEAYNSALAFTHKPEYFEGVVTRAEFLESGSTASRRAFRDWKDEKDKEREKGKGRLRDEDHSEDRTLVPVTTKKLSRTRTKSGVSSASLRRRL
jgi:actin-related protein 6